MTAEHTHKPNKPSALTQIRAALSTGAETTPVRLEFERRRLLASVDAEKAPRGIFTLSRVLIGSSAFAALALIAVFAFRPRDSESTAETIPRIESERRVVQMSGLILADEGPLENAEGLREVPAADGAKIVWKDNTAVWAGGASTLTFFQAQKGVHFHKGRILASVTPRQHGRTFEVETPLGRVVVHGTVFSITGDDTRIQVHLHEGRVTFRYAGGTIALRPGQSLEIGENRAPQIRAVDELDIIADLLIAEKTTGLSGPPIPDLGMLSVSASVKTMNDDATSSPAGSKSKRKHSSKTPSTKPAVETAPPLPELFLDPEAEAVEIEVLPKETVEDPAPRIESLLRSGKFEDCIRQADAYLNTHPNAPPADRVQFLKACCQTRSGDLKSGRAGFETYLIRFPEGRYWKRVSNILEE